MSTTKKEYTICNDFTELLDMVLYYMKRGEQATIENIELKKYKAMWNMNMKEAFQNSKEGETIHPTRILLDLKRLEQKYFPEGGEGQRKH